ncbi:MAG: hypothetical protein FD166_3712, partial [Bacteroidetes bacterium]
MNGTLLEHSPEGWDDNLISRTRNEKYHGVSEKFTTPFSFILDGATILRTLLYQHGFEAHCTFSIEQLNGLTLEYSTIFSGTIDFSTFIDEENIVQVAISESSIWETIKASEDTEYEIDIEGNSPVEIQATFPYIAQSLKMNSGETDYFEKDITVGLYVSSEESKVPSLEPYELLTEGSHDIPAELKPFVKILNDNKNFTIQIKGHLKISRTTDGGYLRAYLFKWYPSVGWNYSWLIAEVELAGDTNPIILPIDFTVNETSYADIDQMYGIGFIITGVPPEGSVGAKVLDLSV